MTDIELHPDPIPHGTILTRAPPFLRPAPSGRYWHIVRSAHVFMPVFAKDPYLSVRAWCGQFRSTPWLDGHGTRRILTDREPDEDLCGTCFGRAEAYHDSSSGLVFTPRNYFDDPRWCPNRAWPSNGSDLCLLCGHKLRAAPGPYASGVARHRPSGLLTTDPCPNHGWQQIHVTSRRVQCTAWRCNYNVPFGYRWPL